MRNKIPFLAAMLLVGTFATGCANMERKLSRGMSNTMEAVRLGEWRRTMEQEALFGGPHSGYGGGFLKGLNKTVVRTGVGVYEVVTAPIPPYDPVLSPGPVYPDNYKPNLVSDPLFATDTNLGFSGGDVMPIMPGSRFRIFDTH